jgi:hypothetical protein
LSSETVISQTVDGKYEETLVLNVGY